MKKMTAIVFASLLTAFAVSPVFADTARVDKCVTDNKDEGQTAAVVKAYCMCMDKKMTAKETASVTDWEKTHNPENEACSTEAGWKGK